MNPITEVVHAYTQILKNETFVFITETQIFREALFSCTGIPGQPTSADSF